MVASSGLRQAFELSAQHGHVAKPIPKRLGSQLRWCRAHQLPFQDTRAMKASVAGRVRNTSLPNTRPLYLSPVFEAVINAF